MALKQKLLDNFLVTDTRDYAIRISDKKSNVFTFLKFVDKDELIQFLLSNEKQSLRLNFSLISEDKIEKLKKINNVNTAIEKLKEYELPLNSDNKNNFIKEFQKNSSKAIEKLINDKFSLLKEIKKMASVANNQYKETGIWPLYFCRYFIKGKIPNQDKFIKAPLVLFPINFTKTNDGFVIIKKDNPIYNEKLNYLLYNQTGININEIFANLESEADDSLSYNKIVLTYSNWFASLDLSTIEETKISSFVFEDIDELTKFKTLTLDNSVCISLLDPTGGKIKKDIIEINNNNENPFEKSDITKNNNSIKDEVIASDNNIELSKPLNIYQKYAIQSALTENTIIYGPPGTGKSQVISSIIANIIKNQKTALIVSEKMTALNVIEERIGKLSEICISSFNPDLSDNFYDKINNFHYLISNLKKETPNSSWSESFHKIKNNYDQLMILKNEKFLGYDHQHIFSKVWLNKNIYSKDSSLVFDFIYQLINKGSNSLETLFEVYEKIKKSCLENKDVIAYLKDMKADISSIERIKKFLDKFASSKDKEYLLSNFLLKDKIKNKKFFSKPLKRINYDTNVIVMFLKTLLDLNFDGLSFLILNNFNSFNVNNEDFIIGIFEKHYWSNYDKNTSDLLQTDFENYLVDKTNKLKTIDSYLVYMYINNFKQIYEKMTSVEQEKVNEVFAIAKMKKKKNIMLFATKYYETLKLIFPIWVLNPSQASIIIPNHKNVFDYGIFDEASQMFLERGFPLVYRSKTSIVAGDDKQLKPSLFFSSHSSFDEDDFDVAESLLEKAQSCMWSSFYLKNHYRSNVADLISFSNKFFYNNELEFITKNDNFYNAIEVNDVDGVWENNMNKEEADAVVAKIINVYQKYKTIMVIAFNEKQADLIENLFYDQCSQNVELMNMYNNGAIFFKNLDNAQGNEADLVILSIAYGFNREEKFNQFFGQLSQKNAGNTLNVAITRSKQKMIIFKSFKVTDMKINYDNKNAQFFYDYIAFLDAYSKKDKGLQLLIDQETNQKEESMFKNYIYSFVQKFLNAQFVVLKNINLGTMTIDFGITDTSYSKLYLIINVNKVFDSKSYKNTMENLYAQHFLEDRNYQYININEEEWYTKTKKCINLIHDAINKVNLNKTIQE